MMDTEKSEANIWTLVKVTAENSDIYSIYLEGTDEKFAGRKAGQFAAISMRSPEGWGTPHPFTISGAPEDKLLGVTIKKVGLFTSALQDLPLGSSLRCMGPLGNFCRDIETKPVIIMLGGGVGISPFLSVLRHFRNTKSGNKVTLFWINKGNEDIFAQTEINELSHILNLTVIYCFSREDNIQKNFQTQYPDIFYEKGRLSRDILQRYGADSNAAFYLCGPPLMMDAALIELEAINVAKSAVAQERFTWR
jgi:NAD(P)H-flavin reductase